MKDRGEDEGERNRVGRIELRGLIGGRHEIKRVGKIGLRELKKKVRERKEGEIEAERDDIDNSVQVHSTLSSYFQSPKREEKKDPAEEKNPDDDVANPAASDPPVKFVEAPLPKVNPWNRNKAQQQQPAKAEESWPTPKVNKNSHTFNNGNTCNITFFNEA